MSANSAVTVLRSPSSASEVGCSGAMRMMGAADAAWDNLVAPALGARAAPQSSQNADVVAFSAPHCRQLRGSGLPHAAQNLRLFVLSVPHLVQRMRVILRASDGCHLVASGVAQRP